MASRRGGRALKEFMTIRYLVDEKRREENEKKYLSTLSYDCLTRNWFNDGSITLPESTKQIIENIKNTK
jgi:hypothetical protein